MEDNQAQQSRESPLIGFYVFIRAMKKTDEKTKKRAKTIKENDQSQARVVLGLICLDPKV